MAEIIFFSLYMYVWQLSTTPFHRVPLAWRGFGYNETKEQLFILVIFDKETTRFYKWKKSRSLSSNRQPLVLRSCPRPEEQAAQKYMLKKKCSSHFTPPLH